MCPWLPPKQSKNEDFVWYGYRKWRATADHIVTAHCKQQALTYRRIAAQQARIEQNQKRRSKAA
jgi:hypothetical protein